MKGWTSETAKAARAKRGPVTPEGLKRQREAGRLGGLRSRFRAARAKLNELQAAKRSAHLDERD